MGMLDGFFGSEGDGDSGGAGGSLGGAGSTEPIGGGETGGEQKSQ